MDILISTNVYNTKEFHRVFNIIEKYKEYNVGVEIFPLWHDSDFEEVLKQSLPLLTNIPVSFHGPYYSTEHSSQKGTLEYKRSMEYFEKTLYYSQILNSKYLVYHHNNCSIDNKNKDALIKISEENLFTCNKLADKYGTKILVENAGVIDHDNMLFGEYEFTELCLNMDNEVLIDIGHAHCNGWDIQRLIKNLKQKISAYHIHNNFGKKDEHNRIFNGTLDFHSFLENYDKITSVADLVVEYSSRLSEDEIGMVEDLNYLVNHFYK